MEGRRTARVLSPFVKCEGGERGRHVLFIGSKISRPKTADDEEEAGMQLVPNYFYWAEWNSPSLALVGDSSPRITITQVIDDCRDLSRNEGDSETLPRSIHCVMYWPTFDRRRSPPPPPTGWRRRRRGGRQAGLPPPPPPPQEGKIVGQWHRQPRQSRPKEGRPRSGHRRNG